MKRVCGGLFHEKDNKVRDHDQITGKYKGSAHKKCNTNLRLTKKISVNFHNLRGYDSHLIMQEIGKFDVKKDVPIFGEDLLRVFYKLFYLQFCDSSDQ